ncbi:hypothetical protein EGW08_019771 [Elysia chlorotica]|uniref:Vacuolar protein sorting-associated protein 13 VPS13 adaptor binding domain-containing protein n=1 Tax=Elysia chlorotica TaxID=188477 RepID=A0A433ST73_ELYCH|nr:hypothetical protein EGW08_019771 [Elysia chlorotica]
MLLGRGSGHWVEHRLPTQKYGFEPWRLRSLLVGYLNLFCNLTVGLSITLAASGLTKVATFTPFFLLQNASGVPICVREDAPTAQWILVEVAECKPFYPLVSAKEMKIVAKVEGGNDQETVPFFLNKAHTTLLKLNDMYGGINAECQVSESQMITTFKTYKPGMATVQFVNHLQDSIVTINQTGSSLEPLRLEPQTSQLYTWDNPTGKREVTWSAGKKEFKSALEQVGLLQAQRFKQFNVACCMSVVV